MKNHNKNSKNFFLKPLFCFSNNCDPFANVDFCWNIVTCSNKSYKFQTKIENYIPKYAIM
jgi:hypothetical protein